MEYFMCRLSFPFRQLSFKNFLCWCTNCSNRWSILWIKREFVTCLASKDFTIQNIITWRILIMCSAERFNILCARNDCILCIYVVSYQGVKLIFGRNFIFKFFFRILLIWKAPMVLHHSKERDPLISERKTL